MPLLLGAHRIVESAVRHSGGGIGRATTAWVVIDLPVLVLRVPGGALPATPVRRDLRPAVQHGVRLHLVRRRGRPRDPARPDRTTAAGTRPPAAVVGVAPPDDVPAVGLWVPGAPHGPSPPGCATGPGPVAQESPPGQCGARGHVPRDRKHGEQCTGVRDVRRGDAQRLHEGGRRRGLPGPEQGLRIGPCGERDTPVRV
ncbi:DUF6629 family protein [Streptomyces sp. NPDC048389]|uniref:DUF6629 family protein n=1 Tax=Streptomyces sp. NPDC048389 TaxID=3154622 RepID=UPI003453CDB3